MRRVLSLRQNVYHNAFCTANVSFFKLIHCTETRSFDESPPPPFSNERGTASAAAQHIVVGPSPPEARAQNSNDSTRQLIDLRNAVTAKTTNFCSVVV